jgi:uncharacterized membrane protein YjjP (DUF1212 family)
MPRTALKTCSSTFASGWPDRSVLHDADGDHRVVRTLEAQRTHLIRAQPGELNLGRLSALDAVAKEVSAGELTPQDGSTRIEQILGKRPTYPWWLGLGLRDWVPLVPGVLLLVPGSIGYRSLTMLLSQDVETGLSAGIAAALTAFALAGGLIVANVLVPPTK